MVLCAVHLTEAAGNRFSVLPVEVVGELANNDGVLLCAVIS
jgi:hypothetical protein